MFKGAFAVTLFAVLSASLPQTAAAREPLLMEGKSTLFQRVLVRDATNAFDAPGGTTGAAIPPLQPLYVYARDGDWLQVGRNTDGADLFWVSGAATTPWRQNIVATFDGNESLGRVLFFADEDTAYEVIESEDPARVAGELRKEALVAEQGGSPSKRVVALGPRATPDLRKNLYVMPIIDSEEGILESNGAYVNLMRVAVARANPTATKDTGGNSTILDEDDVPLPAIDRTAFKAGVVFVVDTTISMEPFIRGTRQALEAVYRSFDENGLTDGVSFGLIGYRDNLKAAPGLGYDVKTFVPLGQGNQASFFFDGIDQMNEADTTSRNYREDSYAAIDHALRTMDWSPYGARYIVLVTDASPREAGDAFSATGLTGRALNSLVQERLGAAIAVMHLKTTKGKTDHSKAEASYRDLSRQSNQGSLYFPVPEGDPETYVRAARTLGEVVVNQVAAFRRGESTISDDDTPDNSGAGQDESNVSRAVRSAGRTMQLAYLGRETGTSAPDVFEAVVADRDFDRPGLKPLSIRLLLNKSDLSNLDEALRLILRKGEENILSADQMFNQVLTAAADMSRNPDNVSRNSGTSLADAALITEMLDGLPYQSRIMAVTENDWLSMSIAEQQTILNDLANKVELYARFNENTDLWVDYLGTGAQGETLLYPMRLADLP